MKQKKWFLLIVTVVMLLACTGAAADVLTIDLDTASYEEIVQGLDVLGRKQKEMLAEQFAAEHEAEVSSAICFRGVPWLATKAETEALLGHPSSSSKSRVAVPGKDNTVNSDGIGIETTYKSWSVAGYTPEKTTLCYVYPVVDGVMLRDDDLALFYLARYNIWDIGDPDAAVEDLKTKLTNLYGAYTTDRQTLVWKDEAGNVIRMYFYANRIELTYYSAEAENRYGQANQAIDDERAQQELLNRIQNENNTDGL